MKSEAAKTEGDHGYQVVLVRDELESVVFSGDLAACEDWLALNGSRFQDGYLEIKPASI